MHSPNIHYWLAATRLSGIGPIKFRRWLTFFNNIDELFSASISELQNAGLSAKEINLLKDPDWNLIEKEIQLSEKSNCFVIAEDNPHYPKQLREVIGAPLLLYVRGNPELLSQPQIAIVGSRNPTALGSETAEQFANCLAKMGFVITSGLALGIDAVSHRGALNANGKTIAVLGTGLNEIYPRTHRKLSEEIAEHGALVSELSLAEKPKAQHFPMRNRIISGLSLGILVAEAALHSGSLITARFALEQGREIFAIPGSIHNPMARGCHYLIRQGAKLVETAEDILEELAGIIELSPAEISTPNLELNHNNLTAEQKNFLQNMDYETMMLDTIIQRSGLTSAKVSSILLALELAGYVRNVSGGYIRISR